MLYRMGEAKRPVTRRMVKLRMYPTPSQASALADQGHAARALWNVLHEWYDFHAPSRWSSFKEADEAIRQGRRELAWLAVLPAQACQQVLKQYAQAWQSHLGGSRGRPRYRARSRTKLSVDVPQASALKTVRLNRKWGEVSLPLIGRVRFRYSRELPGLDRGAPEGRTTGARLVREADGWYLVFRCECIRTSPAPGSHPGPAVGIDRGVAVPLATSDRDHPYLRHGPWLQPKEAERLLRLERKVARQRRSAPPGKPVSRRQQRTCRQIAALHAREKRRRSDWQHKITTTLADRYGLIGIEKLHVAAMTASARGSAVQPGRAVAQKSGLNLAIRREGWGRLQEMLEYTSRERGGLLVPVPAANTSRRCSACGHVDARNRKSQAVFACTNPECGYGPVNADVNSAYNIETDALHAASRPNGSASSAALGSRVDGRRVPA
ncbi:RNA-guided endonuclease InsQ/TnpB family protein [Streptomyces endophytica]|uniref:Transposase n=1 Tax=Streptomyces endophytica TaxID=2991496 RepID=A0ABY6P7E7_9ACTN|nr:transposase [Streptomyces endophytica]UZJ29721.1 transposase [Streptomyces endophytica]